MLRYGTGRESGEAKPSRTAAYAWGLFVQEKSEPQFWYPQVARVKFRRQSPAKNEDLSKHSSALGVMPKGCMLGGRDPENLNPWT